MMVMLGRSLQKHEVVYSCKESEDAQGRKIFSGSLSIPANDYIDAGVFEGQEAGTIKEAELSAAQACVDALEPLMEPLIEARKELKKIKEMKNLEAKRRRTEEHRV